MAQTAENSAALPNQVDQELLELPSPPKGRRILTLTLMALVVVGSMAVVADLRFDLAYFFSPAATTDLGSVNDLDLATLTPNTHVQIEGNPMFSGAVRYRRVLTGSEYIVFPLAGQRSVYIQVDEREGALEHTQFSGRLVTFSQLGGRISAVERYFGDTMDMPVSGESFLIIADESPDSYAWTLLVAAFCLLFVLIDVFLFLRWFRPLQRG